ncbi:MAG: hypothetical protein BZ138_08285, partial [Methanosphaera sp. rholeuAM270]
FINSTITGNKVAGIGATMANIVITGGTINFIDNCYIANNNKMTAFIGGTSSTINIIGNNIFTNQTGVGSAGENMTIIGNNTFTNLNSIGGANYLLINGTNKFYNSTDPNGRNILTASKYGLINGENIFENIGAFISGGNITINGSNIFNNTGNANHALNTAFIVATNILINGSNKFTNHAQSSVGGGVYINNNLGYLNIMGENLFENITTSAIIKHTNPTDDGTTTPKLNVTGTYFINNNMIGASNGENGIFYLGGGTRPGNSTISNNYFINNTFTGNSTLIKIYHRITASGKLCPYNITIQNNIIDGINAEDGGAILINEVEGVPSVVKIINNTFKNIRSNNETINLPKLVDTTITNNTYENCT